MLSSSFAFDIISGAFSSSAIDRSNVAEAIYVPAANKSYFKQLQIKFNGQGYLNFEHWRPKIEKEKKEESEQKEGEETAEAKPVEEAGEDMEEGTRGAVGDSGDLQSLWQF